MVNNIQNKNILLFCADFYGYDKAVKQNLIKLGAASVILKDNIIFSDDSRDNKGVRRKISNIFNRPKQRDIWTRKLVEEISGKDIDILFCIQYTPFSKWFIDYLKKANPNVRTLLFLWDDIATYPYYKDYYEKFDKVYSFDKYDCKNNRKFKYLPDFYLENKDEFNKEQIYDVCFIGSLNYRGVKRIGFLKAMDSFCKKNNLTSFLYLRYYENGYKRSSIRYWIANRKYKEYSDCLNSSKYYDFMKESNLSLSDVEDIQNKSRCLIDISYGNRCGYTLNVVSAIAKGKKLITTNRNIVNEEFYNPNNICVVDIDNPDFSIDFFRKPSTPTDISYLRIDNWLLEIFE